MKSIRNYKIRSGNLWSSFKPVFKGVLLSALILVGVQTSLQAQDALVVVQPVRYTQASWWFGVAGGANFNFYQGTTQQLTTDFMAPTAFHDGYGIGLFAAPLIEFHRPDSRLGFMLQAGIDSRRGSFDQVLSPCNCPEDLDTDLGYITIEPSLRLAPFKSNFYLYAGPRFAFNMNNDFTYQMGVNPAFPEQGADPEVNGEFSNTNEYLISMQIGAGFDIPLSSETSQSKTVLSPFVSFHPYFGQDPREKETGSWNVTTIRAGLALKFGRGHEVKVPVIVAAPVVVVVVPEPEVTFTVDSPKNIPGEITVTEVFPLRNYVFFDLGSTDIPNRYVKMNKNQVKDFREDQLSLTTPENLSGSSKRQMIVYYNVLNILGDRMVKNPSTSIILVGSSEKGPIDGREMAESVKNYLVDVFGIKESRIATQGQYKPKVNEEQPGGTVDLALLRENDRRVTIETRSPELLMEFTSGPYAPLKPVRIVTIPEAPVESYVSFNNDGAEEAFTTWSLEIADEQGTVQNFGPYTEETVTIPGKDILGTRPEGTYKITMVGQTESGKTIKKETSAHLVLWTPAATEEMMRFSIIYEFNDAKAIKMYDKYLTEIVTPKIPMYGTVIIHGHTDIIGGEDNNLKLSQARANDTKSIIADALAKAGRTDVKFQVNGFGEVQSSAPFGNNTPEERAYNRSVIIDITGK